MPLLDISLVMQTLTTLIEGRVRSGADALYNSKVINLTTRDDIKNTLVVSPQPIDELKGVGNNVIGLFLYHVMEDPHFKNLPPKSQDQPPVQFRPMGIDLYYQLIAHSDLTGVPGALRCQLLFGLALKALHDFASIGSSTTLNGAKLFPPHLDDDNGFRIVLQAIQPSEAPHYWTGGTQPLRLAAYYIVSVVLLEPEQPSQYAGRVLGYGVPTFVAGAPRLSASSSTVVFLVPGETVSRELKVQPAEVPIGGQIKFYGTDLTGDNTTLVLKNIRFPNGMEADSGWGAVAGADQIVAKAAPKIGSFDTIPGIYSALCKVTTRRRMPDGSIQSFSQTSNEVPFLVTPEINTVTTAAFLVTVTGLHGIFQNHDIAPESVKIMIGSLEIPQDLPAPANPSLGHFCVDSATQLRIQFPISGLNSGETLPLRIMINGTENAPRWVTVP